MKRSMALVFAVALVPSSHAASVANNLGFYHWGGQCTTSMSEGVERIAQLGGHVARVVLAPTYYQDYNIGTDCYPGYSLSAVARDADVKRALGNASIDVFMLTAYDGTTFGDCEHAHFLNPSFYTPDNTAALSQEYSDFTLYLYRTYGTRTSASSSPIGKAIITFIVRTPLERTTTPPTRNSGLNATNYATLFGNSSVAESIQGLTLWYQARAQGIA